MASVSKKNKRRREVYIDTTQLDINVQMPKRKSQRFVQLEAVGVTNSDSSTFFRDCENEDDQAAVGVTNSDSSTLFRDCENEDDQAGSTAVSMIDSCCTANEEIIAVENTVTQKNKTRAQVSCREYYSYKLQGNKVQATLFDNAITAFEDTLLPQKTYLISNAQVKETDKNYAAQIGNIRWTINAKTNIVEVNEQFNSLLSSAYTFIPFQNLQPYMDTNAEISIIGIAIDIFPKRVIHIRDSQSTVQDVILIDERSETRMLQMWDNFVTNECNTICNTITKKPVLVGSRLKVTSFNGISISTKMNSSVLINPPFEQVLQLQQWLKNNTNIVNDIVAKKAYIFPTSTTISYPPKEKIVNIKQVQQLQHMQKHFWTKANVTLVPLNQPLWYLSCDNCNKSASATVNETYFCRFCKHNYATPTPRARANVELQDSTGSIAASIIGDPAEKFLKCPANELMKQTAQELMENNSTIQTTTTHEHILYIKTVNMDAMTNKAPYEVIFILDSQLQQEDHLAINMTQQNTSHISELLHAGSSRIHTPLLQEADKHANKKQKQE